MLKVKQLSKAGKKLAVVKPVDTKRFGGVNVCFDKA
jgi:hypothetical protein